MMAPRFRSTGRGLRSTFISYVWVSVVFLSLFAMGFGYDQV